MCRVVFVRLSVMSAFLALIMVVAGCGGGGSSSVELNSAVSPESAVSAKEAFIEEVDAECADYQARTAPIKSEIEEIEGSAAPESPQNEARLGELLRAIVDHAEVELGSIRELEPPPASKSVFETMLDTAEEANGLGAEAGKALEEGETPRFAELAKELEPANAQSKKMAERYGLKVCGQEP
jgi:hypothetical protein